MAPRQRRDARDRATSTRSRTIVLGSFRLVSLPEAREKAHANRKLAREGR